MEEGFYIMSLNDSVEPELIISVYNNEAEQCVIYRFGHPDFYFISSMPEGTTFEKVEIDVPKKGFIDDNEQHFPKRRLTSYEKKLLIAKLIKYTSTDLSNTVDPSERLRIKLADSRLIQRFITHCKDEDLASVLLDTGAWIRNLISSNKHIIGLQPQGSIVVVKEDKPN